MLRTVYKALLVVVAVVGVLRRSTGPGRLASSSRLRRQLGFQRRLLWFERRLGFERR